MSLKFTKMTAAGNDFIVFDNRDDKLPQNRGEFIKRICKRKFSVGANGVLLIEESKRADFKMRYYNSDGGEVEMCGNGGRCVSRYAWLKKIAPKKLSFETMTGIYHSEVADQNVKLQMLDPHDFRREFNLTLNKGDFIVNFINTGVPHVVLFVEELNLVDVVELGREIRYHREFKPEGTNANFAQIESPNSLKLRTYERGVEDETLACGTGAVATAVVGTILGKLNPPVNVHTKGGFILKVHLNSQGELIKDIALEGEARVVFEGKLCEY